MNGVIETCNCDHCRHLRRHQPQYQDLKWSDGKLAGRYDPARGLLELQRRGATEVFDLAQILSIANGEQMVYNK
jgi:hypothetical protein